MEPFCCEGTSGRSSSSTKSNTALGSDIFIICIIKWIQFSGKWHAVTDVFFVPKVSMGYCEEEDARRQTQQFRTAEGLYQSNLGSHNTRAVPQTDGLHTTPHCCSNSGKRSPQSTHTFLFILQYEQKYFSWPTYLEIVFCSSLK